MQSDKIAPSRSYYKGDSYRAGDVAYIYPENSSLSIERMIKILHRDTCDLKDDTFVSISYKNSIDRKRYLGNTKCTLHSLFAKCLDINGTPQRNFFLALSQFAKSDEERDKLCEIASAEGNDLYIDYCIRARRSYIDILEDFRSVCIPLKILVEIIPRIQPRQYSIASSGLSTPSELQLCIGLVRYTTKNKRKIEGVCSRYISYLNPGDRVMYSIRKGSITIGEDDSVILIGPGTGVAPMRSIIHEKLHTINSRIKSFPSDSTEVKVVLFFGCRNKKLDFLYEKEWKSLSLNILHKDIEASSNVSSAVTVIPAFSRDYDSKEYVTDKITEHGEMIWDLINKVFFFFISRL
jgi:sulfite reductase alpha subunit-like flavoprotein